MNENTLGGFRGWIQDRNRTDVILLGLAIAALLLLFSRPAWPAEEAPPKVLAIGSKGTLQFGGLLQAWHAYENKEKLSGYHQLRLRRAEIKLKGELVPKEISYEVMFDPAKVLEKGEKREISVVTGQDADGKDITAKGTLDLPAKFSVLQDFAITYKWSLADASIGQFKIPVSYEGYNSSSKLPFPERSIVAKKLGDARDIGVRLAKTFEQWGYAAGIFNGSGLNVKDANDDKDMALRLEAYPLSGLTAAGVLYSSLLGSDKENQGKKLRYEGDLKYEPGWFLFQGEFIGGTDEKGSSKTHLQGFYALLGYTFNEQGVQPVARVGQFDPNTDAENDHAWHYDLGVNYFLPRLKQHEAKIQVAVSRFTGGSDPKAGKRSPNETQIITAFQAAF